MNLSLFFAVDFLKILEKAKEEGFVTVKWTNFAMFGASGVGKTSLLNLLLRKKPVCENHSTTVIQAPEPCLVYEDADDNDESTDECLDSAGSRVTEVECNVIMGDGCYWISADPETIKIKFLQALKSRVRSGENQLCEPQQLIDDRHSNQHLPLMSRAPTSLHVYASSLDNELLQMISEVEESDELYKTHWIYGIDSGGQAAFLDIAPALLRYHSLNIVFLKLDEMLDDTANFFYSVHGKKLGDGERRQMSTMQLTKSFFRCKSQLHPPLLEGVENIRLHGRPHFIVVGTCYDEYQRLEENNQLKESLKEKNERLCSELREYEDVRIDYAKGSEIIFPINTLGRSKNEICIAQRIRQITCQSYVTAEVPARWFFIQLELKSKTTGRRVITFDECLEIEMSIGMQLKEVKAALWYFHNLTLYLYFPDILPKVVFLDPQLLFDKLSELIAVSYGNDPYDRYTVATIRNLKERGVFERDILDTFEFEEHIFSSGDFLTLMQGLLIISEIPNDTGYFIPCVLDTIEDPASESVGINEVEPLFLTWGKHLIPNGLFTSLVVFLLHQDFPTQFQLGNDIHRNKVVSIFCL